MTTAAVTTTARYANWLVEAIANPRGFHVIVTSYMATLFVLRGFLFPAASSDDAEQLLFAQELAWGYDIRNPPLYTWLVFAAQRVMGVSIHCVAFVKFAALGLAFEFLYASGRRVLRDLRVAALAALSPLAIYYVGWDAILSYSHTVLLMAVCAATLYLLLRIDDKGTIRDYLLLGLVLGIGALSKYTYGLFVVALAAAALSDGALRRRLINVRMVPAVALAIIIAAPHYTWLLEHTIEATQQAREHFALQDSGGVLVDAATGLGDLIKAYINFHLSLVLLLLLLFWPAFTAKGAAPAGPEGRHQRLLGRFLIAAFVVLVVMVVVFGVTRFRTHYLFILFIFPLYVFSRIEAAGADVSSLRRLSATLALLPVAVIAIVAGKAALEPLWCRKCALHVPFAELARELRNAGFERGKVVSWFYPHLISGNLRVHFPDSTFASAKYPQFSPAALELPATCLAIWDADRLPDGAPFMLGLARDRLGATLTGRETVNTIDVKIPGNPNGSVRFAYVLIPPGQGLCS